MSQDNFIAELWSYAAEVPMEQHPWFDGIIKHRWSKEQIILGEVQHYLRVRTNPIFFGHMAINAVSAKEYAVMETVLENFMEELGGKRTHVDIMLQFLEEGGITREEADNAESAPGTLAAIEMIIGCCQEVGKKVGKKGRESFHLRFGRPRGCKVKSKDLTRATASPSAAIEFVKFIASPAAAPSWLAAGLELAEPC